MTNISLSHTSINSVSSFCLHLAFSDMYNLVVCGNTVHTHCLWSLTPLQSVFFSPAADGSYSPCVLCGSWKHLQGTGSYNKNIKSLGTISKLCNIMLHKIGILQCYCNSNNTVALIQIDILSIRTSLNIISYSHINHTDLYNNISWNVKQNINYIYISCVNIMTWDHDCTCGPCALRAGSRDRLTGHRSHRTASAAPACGRHRTSASESTHRGPLENSRHLIIRSC